MSTDRALILRCGSYTTGPMAAPKTLSKGTPAPRPTGAPGHWPFDPSRLRFYYGWVIAVVAAIGMIASVPGQTAGVGVFTNSLTEATGLSRLELSIAYLVGTGSSGLLLPKAGRNLDRWGSRVAAAVAVAVLSMTMIGLSFVGQMSTTVGLVVMSIGFGFLRFSGQGVLTLASRTMLSQWFERRRGIVSAVSNSFVGFFFAATPALLLALINIDGFRTAWRILAVVTAVGVGLIVVTLFRNTPESCGLQIDGGVIDPDDALASAPIGSDRDTTRSQALRDPRFWVLSLPPVALSTTGTALSFHIVDFGSQLGLSEAEIVRIFVPIALVSVPVGLLGGWMVDRASPVAIAVVAAVAQLMMCLTIGHIDQTFFAVAAIAGWGLTQGCFSALTSAGLPRMFGRRHLGSIAGLQMSMLVVGSAIGPALFATVDSLTGSYGPALWICALIPLSALALLPAARRADN